MTGLPEIQLMSVASTAGHWLLRDDEEFIDLHAPYQRGSVWTVDQRRALIKSLYMGLPVGAVITSVLPATEPFHIRVVDGKQRIEALRAFVNDEFTIPYSWLRTDDLLDTPIDMPDVEVHYSQCSDRFRRAITMHWQMPALEFRGEYEFLGRDANKVLIRRRRTPGELLAAEAEIYGLINSAGTAQTAADLHRAALIAAGLPVASPEVFDYLNSDEADHG